MAFNVFYGKDIKHDFRSKLDFFYLAGPGEAGQWAYVSGNPDAIAAVDAAYAAQFQAAGGIVDHMKAAVSAAYDRNGTAGAASMMLTTLGVEVLGSKGSGAVLGTAGKAAEIVRLAKTPAEAAAALTKEAAAAKLAGRSAKEIEVLEKAAAEREAASKAAESAKPKEGVVVKRKKMEEHKPKCFKPGEQLKNNWTGSAKDLEKGFYKQLKDQEAGLNKMSVGQYLENLAQYEAIGRSGEAAQGAMRAAMEKKIADSMEAGFLRTMGPADAAAKAVLGAKEAMGSLAALHGPDLKAGGSGALTGLGDAGINSSLGAQWSSKVGKMDTAAIDAMHAGGPDTPMNVTLERCP